MITDKEEAIELLKKNPKELYNISTKLLSDKDVMFVAIMGDSVAYYSLDDDMKNDEDIEYAHQVAILKEDIIRYEKLAEKKKNELSEITSKFNEKKGYSKVLKK